MDREIPIEWAQRTFYGGPVIAKTIDELIGRISLFTTDTTTVLRLWDPDHQTLDVDKLLGDVLHANARFTVAASPVCTTPVETGYLECVRLTASKDGASAAEAIAEFRRQQLERYADMERHLVDLYGTLTPAREADPRFQSIDYSAFDLGPVKLGLGLFADSIRYRHLSIWCWSRVVNWHK